MKNEHNVQAPVNNYYNKADNKKVGQALHMIC